MNFKILVLNFRKNVLTVIIFVLALYGVLCTVYSDVIVQNKNNFITIPYQSLANDRVEATFSGLLGKKELKEGEENIDKKKNHNNSYIFILDISGSIENINIKTSLYTMYKEGIESAKVTFGCKISENAKPTVLDVAKVQLFKLLRELYLNKGEDTNDEFAIWTLGDEGKLIYPSDRKIKIEKQHIRRAIEEIDKIPNRVDRNTNFAHLFRRLTNEYKKELEEKQLDEYDNPYFIITIISDLVHDVKNEFKDRSEKIEKIWEQLKEKIQQISYSRTMANLIVFSDIEPNIQKTIFHLFKSNMDWYRLNKVLIGEEKCNTFLYTVKTTPENIIFYYTNPQFISNSEYIIKSADRDNDLKVDIPEEVNLVPVPKISLFCKKCSALGKETGEGKRLVSGGSEFEVKLGKDQQLKLIYNGRVPANLSVPVLRLSMSEDFKTILIPILFIKKLPKWASWIFIILQVLFVICLLVIPLSKLIKHPDIESNGYPRVGLRSKNRR